MRHCYPPPHTHAHTWQLTTIIHKIRCKDEQTSADVSNVASFNLPANSGPKGAGGACTNALLANVYNSSSDFTWVGLLRAMQKTLKTKGYTQIPQLSASRAMDLKNDKFSLLNPRSNGNLKVNVCGAHVVDLMFANGHSPPVLPLPTPFSRHCSLASTTLDSRASWLAATMMSLVCRSCWTALASSATKDTSVC